VDLEIRFSAGRGRRHVQGVGQVVNVSSSGVAFRSESPLDADWYINASMQWPVALNGNCALRIAMTGRIVRVTGDVSVMNIETYEFRTSGRAGAQGAEAEALKRRVDAVLSVASGNAAVM